MYRGVYIKKQEKKTGKNVLVQGIDFSLHDIYSHVGDVIHDYNNKTNIEVEV